MKWITLLTGLIMTTAIVAQQINIIPQPAEMTISDSKEKFILDKKTKIVFPHGYGLEKYADYFNDYLYKYYKFKLQIYGRPDEKISENVIYKVLMSVCLINYCIHIAKILLLSLFASERHQR